MLTSLWSPRLSPHTQTHCAIWPRGSGPFSILLLVPVSGLPILGLSSVIYLTLVLSLPIIAHILDHTLDSLFSETPLPLRFLPDHNLLLLSPSPFTINLLPTLKIIYSALPIFLDLAVLISFFLEAILPLTLCLPLGSPTTP